MFASMCAASFHRIPLGTRNSSKRSTQEHFCSVLFRQGPPGEWLLLLLDPLSVLRGGIKCLERL